MRGGLSSDAREERRYFSFYESVLRASISVSLLNIVIMKRIRKAYMVTDCEGIRKIVSFMRIRDISGQR